MSINDYEVLRILAQTESGLLKRVELARRLVLSPSGMTRLLEGLEDAGLVERVACPSDQRVIYTRLTPAGASRFACASREHERFVAELLESHLTEEELDSLSELLAKIPA